MKTKIVYVLVSQESDYYYEMLLLSHYSIRLYHPKGDTEIVLVMDVDTHQRLVDKRASILDDVTPVVVDIPEVYTVMQRSRYIKTSLRQRISGDFLYIDTDTLICEKLDEIDYTDAAIAMVSDANGKLCKKIPYASELCKKAGFANLDGQPYFNGGVIFARDVSSVSLFFNEWHRQWQKSLAMGVSQDQPALCQTNVNHNNIIKELSEIWNCQISFSTIEGMRDSKIIHYFSPTSSYVRKTIFEHIKTTERIEDVNDLIQNPRTVGISVFTISNCRFLRFLCSNQIYVYDTIPKLYKVNSRFSSISLKLYSLFSKFIKL